MILGPISALDCIVFVFCLVPQLFIQGGLFRTILLIVKILPFLVLQLPYQYIQERFLTKKEKRSPFTQNATFFQDVVIRCVRYAFANVPASVGRVFFSKWVAYPFFRFRLLRHGFLKSPIPFHEITRRDFRGIWVTHDPTQAPDVIIFYCHGGGFSMGSSFFYLEFLMTWAGRLKDKGLKNPAVFALEYTLVPDQTWPTQLNETRAAYNFICETFGEGTGAKICVSGDSAGATLVLSLLLQHNTTDHEIEPVSRERPGLALLLSPWTHLVSELNQNTRSDYLDKESLHLYARQYAGDATTTNEVVSPGLCRTGWKRASPKNGYRIVYGAEEVFAPGVRETIKHIKSDGALVKEYCQNAGIHAWPVVSLFIGDQMEERLAGLNIMTDFIVSAGLETLSWPQKT